MRRGRYAPEWIKLAYIQSTLWESRNKWKTSDSNKMALEEIEQRQLDSSKLTQPPAEYMSLKRGKREDRKAQSEGPVADYTPLHP
ncbi:hypothetical protein AWC38_SpisGene22219 [Stylophora pistillata]|uniref:Uncharacterized protein n=1 Tax=Stylophora pistillata TaxID=50429 RepID=A0A2B4RBT0_STYPI|nr:hypothetical protein AWC38_SpisGene22219 [Stylophora pistillata]